MKLYTEEQVRQAIKMADKYHYILDSEESEIISVLESIELPSDEEIKKYTPYPLGKGFYNPLYSNKWEDGAKWMRNKIQGGNK